MSFLSVLKHIGQVFVKDVKQDLPAVLQYAIPVEKLAGLIFPQLAGVSTTAVDVTTLIQNAVLSVEQKYAAYSASNLGVTGPAKLAEVLTLSSGAVTALLKQEGITADAPYITSIVNVVVSLLNIQPAPATVAA